MNIGIVREYNGKFGYIETSNGIVDFNRKDISLNENIKVGDVVIFRLEQRIPDIYLAKNICVFNHNDKRD